MPKCSKCNTFQSRLNKGALCKQCFNKKIKPAIANEKVKENNNFENKNDSLDDINYDSTNDRSIIDIIKESMIKERKLNADTESILLNQVEFLKQEIAVKNTSIERLITELFEKDSEVFNDRLNGSVYRSA